MILDNGEQVFLWLGTRCSEVEIKLAYKSAQVCDERGFENIGLSTSLISRYKSGKFEGILIKLQTFFIINCKRFRWMTVWQWVIKEITEMRVGNSYTPSIFHAEFHRDLRFPFSGHVFFVFRSQQRESSLFHTMSPQHVTWKFSTRTYSSRTCKIFVDIE